MTGAFPERWRDVLFADVPFYRWLSRADRERFEAQVAAFVARVVFHPADRAMIIDDRVRLVIAALACRLTMNLVGEEYTRLQIVNVYPSTFEGSDRVQLLGNASYAQGVSVSWEAILLGLVDERDGYNVGYHEFAHVLDASDGIHDGIPPLLLEPHLRDRWARGMNEGLVTLRIAAAERRRTAVDAYGSKNVVEFFAEATAAFFEKPLELERDYPEVYALLRGYYRQDPKSALPPEAGDARPGLWRCPRCGLRVLADGASEVVATHVRGCEALHLDGLAALESLSAKRLVECAPLPATVRCTGRSTYARRGSRCVDDGVKPAASGR